MDCSRLICSVSRGEHVKLSSSSPAVGPNKSRSASTSTNAHFDYLLQPNNPTATQRKQGQYFLPLPQPFLKLFMSPRPPQILQIPQHQVEANGANCKQQFKTFPYLVVVVDNFAEVKKRRHYSRGHLGEEQRNNEKARKK